jgi:hypothetical protein
VASQKIRFVCRTAKQTRLDSKRKRSRIKGTTKKKLEAEEIEGMEIKEAK